MYFRRLLQAATREGKAFWTAYRNWVALSTPLNGLVLHGVIEGWKSMPSLLEIALFSIAGYGLSRAETFILGIFRAPVTIYNEDQRTIKELQADVQRRIDG